MNKQRFRAEVRRTQNLLDKTDLRPTRDHLDLFQHFHREWNQRGDRLTHDAREKGASWNPFEKIEGEKMEAVRAYFDGGVSEKTDDRVKHKVGSVYVAQSSERTEENAENMTWKTCVEVAKVLPDVATITPAETFAAIEAAEAVCWLIRTGSISFHLSVHLLEEWGKNDVVHVLVLAEHINTPPLDQHTAHTFTVVFWPFSCDQVWYLILSLVTIARAFLWLNEKNRLTW